MKNITLSVPDDVYRKARLAAARQDTSVSALVAEILTEIASGRSRHASRAAAIAKAFDAVPAFRASDRLTREQINDRSFMRELDRRHRLLDSASAT
jgi:plasmid stability protein